MWWGDLSWTRSCCGPACRPTWANRRRWGQRPTATGERQRARSKRAEECVSLISRHFIIIKIDPKLGVGEQAGTALLIGNRIHRVDQPAVRLGLGGGPGLAANVRLTVGGVFDAQLEVIPGVRFPGIGGRGRPRG